MPGIHYTVLLLPITKATVHTNNTAHTPRRTTAHTHYTAHTQYRSHTLPFTRTTFHILASADRESNASWFKWFYKREYERVQETLYPSCRPAANAWVCQAATPTTDIQARSLELSDSMMTAANCPGQTVNKWYDTYRFLLRLSGDANF